MCLAPTGAKKILIGLRIYKHVTPPERGIATLNISIRSSEAATILSTAGIK
jgi:hypothetical protein